MGRLPGASLSVTPRHVGPLCCCGSFLERTERAPPPALPPGPCALNTDLSLRPLRDGATDRQLADVCPGIRVFTGRRGASCALELQTWASFWRPPLRTPRPPGGPKSSSGEPPGSPPSVRLTFLSFTSAFGVSHRLACGGGCLGKQMWMPLSQEHRRSSPWFWRVLESSGKFPGLPPERAKTPGDN